MTFFDVYLPNYAPVCPHNWAVHSHPCTHWALFDDVATKARHEHYDGVYFCESRRRRSSLSLSCKTVNCRPQPVPLCQGFPVTDRQMTHLSMRISVTTSLNPDTVSRSTAVRKKEAGKEEPGKANVGPDSSRHKGLRKTQSLRPHQRPCFCIPFLIYYLQ